MENIVTKQREYFNTNITKSVDNRINNLFKLRRLLKENEQTFHEAVYMDFQKSAYENYMVELGPVFHEIDLAIKNIKKWAKPRRARTNLINLPAKSYIIPEPLGVTLVIGAWNYPYALTLSPMVAAMAAGNTVILKPSELPPNSSKAMAEVLNSNFDAGYIKVVEGGIPETTELLEQSFDKIFFTGSSAVGKIVYQAAARHLTPVTLELGGKSPAIFTEKSSLKIGIKRLVWAKFLNAGQTCIAPDYILVHKSREKELLEMLKEEINQSAYSTENQNYVQIINQRNTERIINLIDADKVYHGGKHHIESRHIEPTVLSDVSFNDPVMQEEIFGPLLPVISYKKLDDAITQIKSLQKPLACYIFTNDKKIKAKLLHELSFGGGAINDANMHYANSHMPFGGVGNSGIGSYHGKHGFKTFSHCKSVLDKSTLLEFNLKYGPYNSGKNRLIRRILG